MTTSKVDFSSVRFWWNSPDSNFTFSIEATMVHNEIENYSFKMTATFPSSQWVNTLRPRQNGRHLADDMFKCIFLNENVWIPIEISLKFVPKGSINNNPSLFQIMAWCRPGDKPLSEPMMVSSLTHICVTRPQWVNKLSSHRRQGIYVGLPKSQKGFPFLLSVVRRKSVSFDKQIFTDMLRIQ